MGQASEWMIEAAKEIAHEINGGDRDDLSYPPQLNALLDDPSIANEAVLAQWLAEIISRHFPPPAISVEELDQIQAYCDAATEGPWCPRKANPDCEVMVVPSMGVEGDKVADCNSGDDTWFIAKARADLPKLVTILKILLASHSNSA